MAGQQASQTLTFNGVGTLLGGQRSVERGPEPGQRRHNYADVTCERKHHRSARRQCGPFSSGEIGAYLQMRDTILPQAQNQLDEMANQRCRRRCRNQTMSGTAVDIGSAIRIQCRYRRDVAGKFTATDIYRPQQRPAHRDGRGAGRRRHAAGADIVRPISNSQVIGVNLAAGMSVRRDAAYRRAWRDMSCSSQIRPARCRQVLNASGSGNVVNGFPDRDLDGPHQLLTSGSPQLPMFLDGHDSRSPARKP